MPTVEVHDYQARYDRAVRLLHGSNLPGETVNDIMAFVRCCAAEQMSLGRQVKYIYQLKTLGQRLGKSFRAASKQDIVDLVGGIESEEKYSPYTKRDFRIALKRFYAWLRKSKNPRETTWIKTSMKRNNRILPEELLTEDEVEKLINTAQNPRDKAFVMVLYESGCRIGEILSLRVRHVEFDEYGARLMVTGKTGPRRVRIVASAPSLATWFEHHPNRKNPDSPIWVGIGTRGRNLPLNYYSARAALMKLMKRAAIEKRFNPHIFRHSRASLLANVLTEAQMKEYFGWVQDSKMAAVYVHLSGRDVDKALLKTHGISLEPEEKPSKFQVKICPRCKLTNSPGQHYCGKCGMPLSLEAAMRIEQNRKSADGVMSSLLQDEEVQLVLARKLRDLGLIERLAGVEK